MEKLTTEQKLEIVRETATPYFTENDPVNDICEKLIIAGITKQGIGFTEIAPLVKKVGVDDGWILTVEQKRDNCKDECEGLELDEIKTHSDLTTMIATLMGNHSLPEKWTGDCLKAAMVKAGVPVPKKSNLTEWKKAVVQGFRNNPELTQSDMDEIIKGQGIQNYSMYSNMCWGMLNAVANPDVEV